MRINILSSFLREICKVLYGKKEVCETHVVGENPTTLEECVPPSSPFFFLREIFKAYSEEWLG